MPSKFSDQLKQAIIYIKAGEMEIAKEIIMEIIQNDPEYEKAWIWLVETVPDKREKADILKTRIKQFPHSSPLSHRVLQKIALEVLDDYSVEKEPSSIPPAPLTRLEEPEEEEPTVNDIESEGLVEEDNNEFDDINALFEESAKDEEEFSPADRFADLFQDDTEKKDILDENLNLEQSTEEEGYDELLEQDLEQFLQDDLNQGYFKEALEGKSDQPEDVKEAEDETDPLDFDSWLEEDEDEISEEDDLSEVLSEYIDTQEETPTTTDSGEVNPFILNPEESIHLFGEDITEDNKSDENDENTGQSSNAFSAEGLDQLGINDNFESQPDFLSDDMFFPESDQVPGSPVSADDLLLVIENEPAPKAMSPGELKKSSGKIPSMTKKKKRNGKEKNNRQTFIFGCSIIAAIIILSMIGLGILFVKNWQSKPQEPTSIVLPSTTPTEEYILEAPWLEEDAESSTPTPAESEE